MFISPLKVSAGGNSLTVLDSMELSLVHAGSGLVQTCLVAILICTYSVARLQSADALKLADDTAESLRCMNYMK
jgi:hypothetical protein